MNPLLLDTSIIIDAINEKKNRRIFLRELVEQDNLLACCPINVLACCPINVAEVYAGMRPKEATQTTAFLASLHYYPSPSAKDLDLCSLLAT